MGFTTWMAGLRSDHDRLILLEQRLDLMTAQIMQEVQRAVGKVDAQEARLERGNHQFADISLTQQRVDEALAELRGTTSAARLTADNASRGIESLGRAIDQQVGALDRKLDGQREALEDQIATAIAAALAPVKDDVATLKKHWDTVSTQTGLIRVLVNPAVAIALTIATTFVLKWLFP